MHKEGQSRNLPSCARFSFQLLGCSSGIDAQYIDVIVGFRLLNGTASDQGIAWADLKEVHDGR